MGYSKFSYNIMVKLMKRIDLNVYNKSMGDLIDVSDEVTYKNNYI